MIEISS